MKWQMTYLIRTTMKKTFQRQGKRRRNKGTIAYEVGENILHSTSGQGGADYAQEDLSGR